VSEGRERKRTWDWWDEKKKYFIDMSVKMSIIIGDNDKQIENVFLGG
jgi:hypothetical protein